MSLFYKKEADGRDGDFAVARTVVVAIILIAVFLLSSIWWGPIYDVWSSGKKGQAELAQAEYNRQIIVRQAQAKLDASKLEAEAAVQHAQGVADSNKIIANDLGGPEGYLRFLYIQMLQDSTDKQIIYVPTEAGLPILEAGHRP